MSSAAESITAGREALAAKSFTKAVQHADAALKAESGNSAALQLRGEALFGMEEWESAKESFEQAAAAATAAGADAKPCAVWARKCQAELDLEEEEEEGDEAEAAPAPAAAAAAPAAGAPASAALEADAPLPPIARPKVRHEWYQSQTHVVVEVFIKKLRKEDVQVEMGEQTLSVCIKTSESSEFTLDLTLCDKIIVEESKYTILSTKLEIRMKKAEQARWLDLQASKAAITKIKWDDSSSVDKHAYPYSVKGGAIKKNWDAIASTVEEEKLEGDQALNKVFQDIFGKGTDEQRKAMIKSFTESGGTVLSTNWEDVGKRKVEGSAPKGLEMKSWDEVTYGKKPE